MQKLIYYRVQKVEVPLLRTPTPAEEYILLGKSKNETMFDLPEDLINWDEVVVDEDYSSTATVAIPGAEIEDE